MGQHRTYAVVVLSCLCALPAGCVPGYVRFTVDAPPTANQGLPVYMLVRTVDDKAYLGQSYQVVAAKVTEPDPSVLRSLVIYPDSRVEVRVKKPDKGGMAVYFLFTAPGERWKTLLPQPLPLSVALRLESNQIKRE